VNRIPVIGASLENETDQENAKSSPVVHFVVFLRKITEIVESRNKVLSIKIYCTRTMVMVRDPLTVDIHP